MAKNDNIDDQVYTAARNTLFLRFQRESKTTAAILEHFIQEVCSTSRHPAAFFEPILTSSEFMRLIDVANLLNNPARPEQDPDFNPNLRFAPQRAAGLPTDEARRARATAFFGPGELADGLSRVPHSQMDAANLDLKSQASALHVALLHYTVADNDLIRLLLEHDLVRSGADWTDALVQRALRMGSENLGSGLYGIVVDLWLSMRGVLLNYDALAKLHQPNQPGGLTEPQRAENSRIAAIVSPPPAQGWSLHADGIRSLVRLSRQLSPATIEALMALAENTTTFAEWNADPREQALALNLGNELFPVGGPEFDLISPGESARLAQILPALRTRFRREHLNRMEGAKTRAQLRALFAELLLAPNARHFNRELYASSGQLTVLPGTIEDGLPSLRLALRLGLMDAARFGWLAATALSLVRRHVAASYAAGSAPSQAAQLAEIFADAHELFKKSAGKSWHPGARDLCLVLAHDLCYDPALAERDQPAFLDQNHDRAKQYVQFWKTHADPAFELLPLLLSSPPGARADAMCEFLYYRDFTSLLGEWISTLDPHNSSLAAIPGLSELMAALAAGDGPGVSQDSWSSVPVLRGYTAGPASRSYYLFRQLEEYALPISSHEHQFWLRGVLEMSAQPRATTEAIAFLTEHWSWCCQQVARLPRCSPAESGPFLDFLTALADRWMRRQSTASDPAAQLLTLFFSRNLTTARHQEADFRRNHSARNLALLADRCGVETMTLFEGSRLLADLPIHTRRWDAEAGWVDLLVRGEGKEPPSPLIENWTRWSQRQTACERSPLPQPALVSWPARLAPGDLRHRAVADGVVRCLGIAKLLIGVSRRSGLARRDWDDWLNGRSSLPVIPAAPEDASTLFVDGDVRAFANMFGLMEPGGAPSPALRSMTNWPFELRKSGRSSVDARQCGLPGIRLEHWRTFFLAPQLLNYRETLCHRAGAWPEDQMPECLLRTLSAILDIGVLIPAGTALDAVDHAISEIVGFSSLENELLYRWLRPVPVDNVFVPVVPGDAGGPPDLSVLLRCAGPFLEPGRKALRYEEMVSSVPQDNRSASTLAAGGHWECLADVLIALRPWLTAWAKIARTAT